MVAAQTDGRWGPAHAILPPIDAIKRQADGIAVLRSVACARIGDCVAVGSYTNSRQVDAPMIVRETRGVWGRARSVMLPASARTRQGALPIGLSSLACTGPANCEAVLDYGSDTAEAAATVATETNGRWDRVSHITPPTSASFDPGLGSLACTTAGNCVAVGEASMRPMLAVQTDGVWSRARAVAPPPGVRFTSTEGTGHLYSVTCSSAGNCVAAGNYAAPNGSGAMTISETRGIWRRARQVTLPANARSSRYPAIGFPALLLSVACSSPGDCTAVGSYTDARIDYGADGQPLAASETHGDWHRALQLNFPNGGNAGLPAQTSWLTSIACPSRAQCVAVGFYNDFNQQRQAMLLTQQKP